MPQFRVVITDFGVADSCIEQAEFDASGLDIELVRSNSRSPEELLPHITDADGLLVGFATINRHVIERLTRCRVISRYGIGVDMIDIEAATEHGIMVANVPDYCIEEVSNHTLSFLLALNRRLIIQNQHVHAGGWGYPAQKLPTRMSEQILGLVGFGNIGRAVAARAQAFGLRVLAHDPFVRDDDAAQHGVELVTLEELLRTADYVSLHCPLTDGTRHLISTRELALMKPTAFLINMSRGPVVDQPALYQALISQTIAGAALDVYDQEPPPPDEPILQLDNVILTAHTASVSEEATDQLRRETARNVIVALQGAVPRSVVNAKGLGLLDA